MAVRVEFWGPNACITRPEMKVERVSYEVLTPSAARGMLEAIFWHPGLRWVIDHIYVLSPIRFTNIRRNEVKSKISAAKVRTAMQHGTDKLGIYTTMEIQQRAAMVLQDVHYVVEAHFEMTDKAAPSDNPGKFCEMMRRRLSKGQCYHRPYFGAREFPAQFREWPSETVPTIPENRDLGFMLYDMDYADPANITPMFFRARLENGIVHVPAPDSGEVLR